MPSTEPEVLEEDLGAIDRDAAHARALELLPDDFFWMAPTS